MASSWTAQLIDLYGPDRAARIHASTWWPALVTTIDHALARGWPLDQLLTITTTTTTPGEDGTVGSDVDECQALVWRTSITLDPIPTNPHEADYHTEHDPAEEPPADLYDGVEPHPDDLTDSHQPTCTPGENPNPHGSPDLVDASPDWDPGRQVEADLTIAGLIRHTGRTVLEPTLADTRRMYQQAEEWDHCPVTRARMVQINTLTQAYYQDRFTTCWGRDYLADRFGIDLTGDERFRPGQAPTGWTNLVDHLRDHGVNDTEMVATGVATEARTGRIIDRFRDRVMFPVIHHGEILGFVGRRHPGLTDADKGGPKYLNTPDTPLFHKGAQLFGVLEDLLDQGATPVLVEGPMDAIAVTLASAERYLGLTPLGTSLTDEQATQLAAIACDPIVATDADIAGQVAAERDFWMLTPHGLDPGYARFPNRLDPADLLTQHGPAALTAALDHGQSQPLGEHLLTERLTTLPTNQTRLAAMKILAARPSTSWDPGTTQIAARLQYSQLQARRDLRNAVHIWDTDPRKAAQDERDNTSQVRERLTAAAAAAASAQTPAERWAPLAASLDPRLVTQGDWPATAAMLHEAHAHGHDVPAATRALLTEAPLGENPAQDLRYRIISRLNIPIDLDIDDSINTPASSPGAARDRRALGSASSARAGHAARR